MFGLNDDDKDDKQPIKDNHGMVSTDPAVNPEPVFHEDSLEEPTTAISSPSNGSPSGPPFMPPEPSKSNALNPPSSVSHDNAEDSDLLSIKQKALQELSPLVNHLDQTPEEKFKTTMMMIQATDNKKLLPDAYKAAQAITDEKAKAQALLDVINEINYFTQSS
ncbi:MAG TPA: hypothetical protein VMR51_00285 [Patescibacteria group bacterium]|nr:hypothetical protein [Patescibacteria group bacterium]